MACCASVFSSTTLNTPSCTLACLSTAPVGSTFVGADGSIWVFNGTDPCDSADWSNQGDCCIRFLNADTGFSDNCCNSVLTFTSSDSAIGIDISQGTIDLTFSGVVSAVDPLPVANFSTYHDTALVAELNGISSTSTEDGVAITYAWTVNTISGGTASFDSTTAIAPNLTATDPGVYEVTLTITDDNGNTDTHVETICINGRDKCDTYFEIPSTAFINTNVPTDAEVLIWFNANSPFNAGTTFFYPGNGTTLSPDYLWETACTA